MSTTHIANLTTLKANLKKAIQDKETVIIGGGEFSGEELKSLLFSVEASLESLEYGEAPLSP